MALPQDVPLVLGVYFSVPLYEPYLLEHLLHHRRNGLVYFVDELVEVVWVVHEFIPLGDLGAFGVLLHIVDILVVLLRVVQVIVKLRQYYWVRLHSISSSLLVTYFNIIFL